MQIQYLQIAACLLWLYPSHGEVRRSDFLLYEGSHTHGEEDSLQSLLCGRKCQQEQDCVAYCSELEAETSCQMLADMSDIPDPASGPCYYLKVRSVFYSSIFF